MSTSLALYQGGRPFGGWEDVFLLPLRATYIGFEGGKGYGASIGPLLIGLSVCAVVGWRLRSTPQKEAIRLAAIVGVSGVLSWMVLGRFTSYLLQTRLYLAFFPALAFLSAAGFSGLHSLALPRLRLGRLAAFLIALVMGLTPSSSLLRPCTKAPEAILGLKTTAKSWRITWLVRSCYVSRPAAATRPTGAAAMGTAQPVLPAAL
jgi:hypothetical protein